MPFSTAAADQMLDALAGGAPSSIIAYASLHSAYSSTGANELSGGSPAYARQAITWNAAAGSSKAAAAAPPAFNVPAGATVAFAGLWSSLTGGTFAGMAANGGAAQYAFTGASATGELTAPGSVYAADTAVVLWAAAGAALPGGLTEGAVYYVSAPSGDVFKLSSTSGGSAITLPSDGAGIVQAITLEVFGSQGTFTLSSDTLSLV